VLLLELMLPKRRKRRSKFHRLFAEGVERTGSVRE
jgi:hypothetical protein